MDHTLKTARLSLSPLRESDTQFMKELLARPESYQYESDEAKPADEIEKSCLWYLEESKALPDGGAIRWIVRCNEARIGEIHVRCNWEQTSEWEIGWYFLPEYWGNGFATEAGKAVIRHVFAHFKINRLAAFLNAENKRSAALAERIGMMQEGRLREVRLINGVSCDEYVFSILRREFVPEYRNRIS